MSTLLALPVVIPLLTAALCLMARGMPRARRAVSLAGAAALFCAGAALLAGVRRGGIAAVQIGGWPPPFGITLVADLFSAVMVFMAGLMGLAVVFYSLFAIDAGRERFGYHAFAHVLLMGVCGAFLTGDIFNLYVWFEVMLMASFVLMALGGDRAQLEGGVKYVTINLIASALFLSATGILFGVFGTLNMADLAVKAAAHPAPGLVTTLAFLFMAAFGVKAALFPLFFWLPASYHTPPVAVTALFSALLTKVGAYALIRMFTLLFTHETGLTHAVLLAAGGLTMLTGVLGAAAHFETRRILAFHIISQIGYIIMGLGIFTPLSLAGSVFFTAHNILAKTNLFLISGVAHRLTGEYDLKRMGGLFRAHPWISLCFFVSAMSLAGAPPLSGFVGKLLLVVAGLRAEAWTVTALALFVGVLTLYSMTKIWAHAFWRAAPADATAPSAADTGAVRGMMAPVAVITVLIVLMGVCAEPCVRLAMAAGEQLADPSGYIRAVTGGAP